MPNPVSLIKDAALLLSAADTIINNGDLRKAAVAAKKASKKVVKKVIRIDDEGHRVFIYTKGKLSKLYSEKKIPENVYDYLVDELQYVSFFSDAVGTFEVRFKDIIKAKNEEELSKAIERYEKIRSKHISEERVEILEQTEQEV